MKCTHCTKNKNIVYRDYAWADRTAKPALLGKSVNVCWPCLDELGWKDEIKELLPLVKKCPQCKSFYLPKKSNSIKCGLCWKSYFRRIGR